MLMYLVFLKFGQQRTFKICWSWDILLVSRNATRWTNSKQYFSQTSSKPSLCSSKTGAVQNELYKYETDRVVQDPSASLHQPVGLTDILVLLSIRLRCQLGTIYN